MPTKKEVEEEPSISEDFLRNIGWMKEGETLEDHNLTKEDLKVSNTNNKNKSKNIDIITALP